MTFDQIRSEVLERMSLSSSDASTRVGAAINRHYKRITSLLGMETTRYVSKDVVMTVGVRTVTIPGVEKVDRVADLTSQLRPLTEVSLHQMRILEPTTSEPQVWALSNTQAQAVVLMFDTFPDFAWTLRIDGWTTLTDLTGAGEPAFPASFHDILTWFVLAEELLRKEKSPLAQAYEQKALGLLEDLRFHLADTHTRTLRQGMQPGGAPGGSGQGGGGGAPGGAQFITNVPPGTLLGRNSDAGTGNSQPVDNIAVDTALGGILVTSPSGYAFVQLRDNAQPVNQRVFRIANTGQFLQFAAFADDGGSNLVNIFTASRDGNVFLGHDIFVPAGSAVYINEGTALHDFRKGLWTPTIGGTTGESGQSYLQRFGSYQKVGAWVQVTAFVQVGTAGTISGDAVIKGLPYAATANAQGYQVGTAFFSGLNLSIGNLVGQINPGSTTVSLRYLAAGGATGPAELPASAVINNTFFMVALSYPTDA